MRIRKNSFFRQLFLVFLVVMLTANLVLYFYMMSVIKSYVYFITGRNIQRVCLVMQTDIDQNVRGTLGADETFLKTLSSALNYHTWLVNGQGAVIYDTDPAAGDTPAPELSKRALAGTAVSDVTTDAQKESFFTVADPVTLPGVGAGALVVNTPVTGINTAIRDMERTVFLRGVLVVIASVIVSFYFTRKLTQPIKTLILGTQAVGRGGYEKIVVRNNGNELHDLSVSFNEMIERLSQVDEEQKKLDTMKKNFLSDLSHELRTPLTTLEAFLEALKDGVVTDEEKKHRYVLALYEETMHLKRLTSDLLQLARIESGHLVVENVFFDPGEVIANTVRNRMQAAAERGNALVLCLAGEYPPLWCDRDHFRQILANLINNAIQFTADGTITVAAAVEGEFLMVSVTDTGIGIQPEEIPFIWDRFFKADKARSRHQQESGLGLSIVRHLVELHHGRVGVESRPGQGSRFHVLLPLTGSPPADGEATAP